jgi:hypothetical protein
MRSSVTRIGDSLVSCISPAVCSCNITCESKSSSCSWSSQYYTSSSDSVWLDSDISRSITIEFYFTESCSTFTYLKSTTLEVVITIPSCISCICHAENTNINTAFTFYYKTISCISS